MESLGFVTRIILNPRPSGYRLMMSRKKSPITDRPLRQAGQSAYESLQDIVFEQMFSYYFIVVVLWVLALYEWIQHLRQAPPAPLPITLLAVGATAFALFKGLRLLKRAKRYKLGLSGEKVVGEYLYRLVAKGYRVFHDIPGDGWNIDHVIISTRGVYTIETKTRSKPAIGDALVRFNGKSISVDGGPDDERPIRQSLAQTKQLRTMLKEWTGRDFPVRPVVVYPGWFVEQKVAGIKSDVWVLNPKALHKWIEKQNETVPVDQVKQAATALSKYVRSYKS